MKTIGLLGGMSWESSREYYRIINELVRVRLGGLHSARCVLASIDFAEIEALQRSARWDDAGALLAEEAKRVAAAGADFLVLCTNTMHKVAGAIEAAVPIPLLHVADATATAVRARGIDRVGLLGTRFTMEEEFYAERLATHGIATSIPDASDRAIVDDIIYRELCVGTLRPSARDELRRIAKRRIDEGAGGVILGCTELPLLLKADEEAYPLFDTTQIHAAYAVEQALA